MRKRVYVAGSYSADNVLKILNNIKIGTRKSVDVLLAGYAPFCPWLDHQFQFYLKENETLAIEDYYEYSMAWLEVSDAVLVLPNYENSKGTIAEIERAKELGIPVFYSLEELMENIPAHNTHPSFDNSQKPE